MTHTEEKNTTRKSIQMAREEVEDIIRVVEERMKTHNPSTRTRFSDGSFGSRLVDGKWVTISSNSEYFELNRKITADSLAIYKRIIPIYDHIVRNGGDAVDAEFYWSLKTMLYEANEDISERNKEFVTRCNTFFGTEDDAAIDNAMSILLRRSDHINAFVDRINRTYTEPIRDDEPLIDLLASSIAGIYRDEARSEDHTFDGMIRRGLVRFVENLQKTSSTDSSSIKSSII